MTQRSGIRPPRPPDRIDDYVEAHGNVWPEMLEALRAAGIRNYTIFRPGRGVRLLRSRRPRSRRTYLAGRRSAPAGRTTWPSCSRSAFRRRGPAARGDLPARLRRLLLFAVAAASLAGAGRRRGPRARFERPDDPAALRRRRDARAGAWRRRGRPARALRRRSGSRSPRADLAVANLESPLTLRPHDPAAGPNALEARPASAELLAAAGFDAVGVANNHAGDAGPHTVTDTIGALSRAGIVAVGGGSSAARAYEPRIVDVGPRPRRAARVRRDRAGTARRAGDAGRRLVGRARWRARRCCARARRRTSSRSASTAAPSTCRPTDPHVMQLARQLASWGADVVWGQGPHVVQPIRVIHARPRRPPDDRRDEPRQLPLRPAHPRHAAGRAPRGARRAPTACARSGSGRRTRPRRCSSSAGGSRRATRPRSAASGGRSPGPSSRSARSAPRSLAGFKGDGRRRGARRSGRKRRPAARRRLPAAVPSHERQRARAAAASSSTGTASRPTSASTARATCGRSGSRARCCARSRPSRPATGRSPSATRRSTGARSSAPAPGAGAGSASSPCRSFPAPASPACANVDGDGSTRSCSKGAHDDEAPALAPLRCSCSSAGLALAAAGCGSSKHRRRDDDRAGEARRRSRSRRPGAVRHLSRRAACSAAARRTTPGPRRRTRSPA